MSLWMQLTGLAMMALVLSLPLLIMGEDGSTLLYPNVKRKIDSNSVFKRNPEHLKLSFAFRQRDRPEKLREALDMMTGVYHNKEQGKGLGLEKTVFMVVLGIRMNSRTKETYYHYFRNFLCFVHHYNIDVALYVADDDVKAPERPQKNTLHIVNGQRFRSVKQGGPRGAAYSNETTTTEPPPTAPTERGDDKLYRIESQYSTSSSTVMRIDYPYELFWRMVYNKVAEHKEGSGRGSYEGNTPNFKKFGSLPMLVPIYEAILAGYNVMYFDVDTAFVIDPIPYISRGDADFVFGIESRKPCREISQTSRVDHKDWRQVEPNTGTMMVRSTKQSKTLFTQWLEEMIDGNFVNDQKVLSGRFRYLRDMTYTPNCLSHSHRSIGAVTEPSTRLSPASSTYCFLSDVVFENGFTALRCAHADGWNWQMQLHEQGIRVESSTTPIYYPAVIHVNYCNHKSKELANKGLWLMQVPDDENVTSSQMSCAKYGGAGSTYYGDNRNYNITLEMEKFGHERDLMYAEVLRKGPGTTMRQRYGTLVYVLGEDGRLSSFPDQQTFDRMNYSTAKVHDIHAEVIRRFHFHRELPSLITQEEREKVLKEERRRGPPDAYSASKFSSPNVVVSSLFNTTR